MWPEDATFFFHMILLPAFKSECEITGKVIEAVPEDQTGYSPDAIARNAGDLVRHIINFEKTVVDGVIAGRFDWDGVLPQVGDLRELAVWYSKHLDRQLDELQQFPGEWLVRPLTLSGKPTPGVLCLQFALNHTIHHRGQLATYLRTIGACVPSIYGQSFGCSSVTTR